MKDDDELGFETCFDKKPSSQEEIRMKLKQDIKNAKRVILKN
jgi:hypothetical protein